MAGAFWLTGCGTAPEPLHATLTAAPNSTFQSGAAAALVATLNTSDAVKSATVRIAPASGSGSTYTAAVTGITGTRTVTFSFTLPDLGITAPQAFVFSVTGSTGFAGFDTGTPVTVTVQPGPQVLSITPATGTAGSTVSATITGVSTQWTAASTVSLGADITVGTVTATSATQLTVALTLPAAATLGTRDVTVTTGSQALTLKSGFTVQATPVLPPVASAGGPYTGTAGASVAFSAAGSTDPQGQALTYSWSFGDGATGTGVAPSHAYSTAGTYIATVTATNTSGLTNTASARVTVAAAAPQPPVASAGGPYTGTAGSPVTFSAAGSSDPKSFALTYAWTFSDGGTATGVAPGHTFAVAGAYTATVTVTNTAGLSSTATAQVAVASAQTPTAVVHGPYTGVAGTAIAFDGSGSSDPRGETLTYAWTFGDGGTATGVSPSHTYASAKTYTVTLTVTNTDGLSGTATTTATVTAAPQAPTASAGGPYSGTAGTVVTLDGSASSDPGGSALTYAWDFGDGGTGAGEKPAHTYAAAGTYTATLVVTNTGGLTGRATATVTVAAAPLPPVARAGGPYRGTAGTAVGFDGSVSTDPRGQTLTYAWNFGDGGTGAGATPAHTYAATGTYTVTLTVTNTDGTAANASTTATIAAAAQAPVAKAGGPYTGTAGQTVAFTGAGSSDPLGRTLTFSWNFGDGGTATGATPNHTYDTAGTFTAMLTVTNSDGLTATDTATVTIAAAPRAPTAVPGGPYSGNVSANVAFDGSGSTDPQGQTLTYAWSFGDGGTATGATPGHIYTAAGTYTVTLTVTNTSGQSASSGTTATITASRAQPPLANAGGPYTGTTGSAITFNGLGSSDPRALPLTYAWNFGDGGTGTGAQPSHTYATAGSFFVTLTVTNTDGASGSAQAGVTVQAAATVAPVARAAGPYDGYAGDAVRFSGSASYDPSQPSAGVSVLTLAWDFGDGGTAAGPAPYHSYAAAGTYTVTLTATNAAGTSASATATATIQAAVSTAPAPVANAGGPYKGALKAAVQFNGSGSTDPGGKALTYSWDFGDGSSGDGVNPSHTYAFSGTFTVVLTVSNGANLGLASTTVVIPPGPPAPALLADAGGPYTVAANQPLTLDGSKSTNPNQRQLVFAWDFGDGTSGTGARPIHVYTASGTYTVTVNVTDGLTGNGNATAIVTVSGPAAEQVNASAGGPYATATGRELVLDASLSSDNLSKPLTFAWDFGDGTSGTDVTPSHTYSTPGTYTATVTVSGAAANATATAQVSVAKPLTVTITSPTVNQLFGAANNTVSVTGTVSAPGTTVAVNGVQATVSGTGFTANGVPLREGVNLITATATDTSGGVGTGSVSAQLDVTAPRVSITSPAANAVLSAQQITVSGLINDIVTGTIGSNDITITVNGQPAQVSNRSYTLSGVQLVPGNNTITVVATDRVGNTSTTVETVQLVPASTQFSLAAVSGDGQTAAVKSVLPQPLVVQLVSSSGVPVAGRPVTFTVTRSDGVVTVMPTSAQTLSVTTDAAGKASVLFTLGSRNGLGVNQVSATTPGAAGAVLFNETSTLGAAAQIHAVRGESQRGVLGAALPEAFQVIVQDGYGNPVPGTAVQWSTVAGDGTLSATSVVTDSNGKAITSLTLGQQEGVNNYVVSATFAGLTGTPVTFTASGFAPGPVSQTSVSGVVLDNANTPIPNATVTLAGTQLTTVSDANGMFKIAGAPVGTVTLTVDGSTSTRTQTFPFLSFVLQSLPGQNNSLPKPIYLPFVDVNDAQTVGGDDAVTLSMAGVPGVSFVVAPHSVTFPDGSTVGKLSLSQVKSDMVPMEPTNGTSPDLIWTLQPAGTRFSVPVQVTLPNTQGLAPGAVSEFYQYDHDLEQFVSAGTMHVSADGSVMVSDPGFGITKAGWGHGAVTPVPPDCVVSCKNTNPCVNLFAVKCQGCGTTYNEGIVCGRSRTDQCHTYGFCKRGVCNGSEMIAHGTPCDGDLFCSTYACDYGECKGKPVPDISLTGAYTPFSLESTLTQVAEAQRTFFGKFGIKLLIKPDFSLTEVDKLICCESKKQMNVEVDQTTLNVGIKIEGPEVIPVIGTVPLGVDLPYVGKQGVTVTPAGTIAGVIGHTVDDCKDQDCFTGGVQVGIQLEGKITGGADDSIRITASVSAGLQGAINGGCGVITGSVAFTGLVLKGQISFLNTLSANFVVVPIGAASFTTTYDMKTGEVTNNVQ